MTAITETSNAIELKSQIEAELRQLESDIQQTADQEQRVTAELDQKQQTVAQLSLEKTSLERDRLQKLEQLRQAEAALTEQQKRLIKQVENRQQSLKRRADRINELLKTLSDEYDALLLEAENLTPDFQQAFGGGKRPLIVRPALQNFKGASIVSGQLLCCVPGEGDRIELLPIGEAKSSRNFDPLNVKKR